MPSPENKTNYGINTRKHAVEFSKIRPTPTTPQQRSQSQAPDLTYRSGRPLSKQFRRLPGPPKPHRLGRWAHPSPTGEAQLVFRGRPPFRASRSRGDEKTTQPASACQTRRSATCGPAHKGSRWSRNRTWHPRMLILTKTTMRRPQHRRLRQGQRWMVNRACGCRTSTRTPGAAARAAAAKAGPGPRKRCSRKPCRPSGQNVP